MNEIKRSTKYQNHIAKITARELDVFDESKTFFTSDCHFFHKNIIEYCDRPWKSPETMTQGLIKEWNSVVPPDADIYNMGDLTFIGNDKFSRLHPIISKLNGRIHLVLGNHDRISHNNYIEVGIHSVHYPYIILPNGWICFHDPALAIAFPKSSMILSGHVHNLHGKAHYSTKKQVIVDCGIDAWDYKPVSVQQIKGIVSEMIINNSTNNY